MIELLFATGNPNKAIEIRALLESKGLRSHYQIRTLADLDIRDEIAETAHTFAGNAQIKAEYLHKLKGMPVFAEDSGLVVPSLGGQPGVFSARYAGPAKNDQANYELLLERLKDKPDRSAYFQTVICFVDDAALHFFNGKIDGHICKVPRGDQGFGYDPIFIPEGSEKTFAEFSSAEKNAVSHRARAMQRFLDFLQDYIQ